MAIIYSYPETTDLLPTDMLVGTSTIRVAGKKKNITKNFTLDALRGFILQGYSTVTWGSITGILSNQTDLQAALNAKQGNITLTTTGSTGAATLIGNTLNIPNYASGIVTPTLNQVLTAGNVSLLDAKVGSLYSYDTINADYGIVQFYDSGVSLKAATTNNLLFFNDDTGTVSFSNGIYDPILNFAGVGNNVYTFQNANGTLAFLSDIPSVSGYVPTSRTLTINGTSYDLTSNRSWSVGTVTSVGLSMPSAFTVSSSPVTGAGTIAVTGAGTASQYIRGDGTLATLPSGGGGGSSVNYYLNGSINASVATYKQLSNTAVIGVGTDFQLIGNGLISQFLTDVGNPNRLEIPGGAWNFEMFFSMSSNGGTPAFYVELLKYDGVTFTSIASNSTAPENITGGTSIDLYLTSLAVPTTPLLVTDRLAIRVYIVNNSGGRTATLHTEDNHLCEIITTFSGGVTSLNGLTANTQYFAVGTSGLDFNILSTADTHTFNLPSASSMNRGALNSADWITFNSKANASGTTNYVSKFTGTTTLGNSQIFDNGTNVGIGTASPAKKLDVIGAIRASDQLESSKVLNSATISNTPANASLLLYAPTTTNYYGGIIGWAEGNVAASIAAYDAGSSGALGLSLATGNNTAISEKMRITDTGNVGIGTTNPANAKLKVSGSSASGAIISEDTSSTTSFVRMLGDISSQNLLNWQSGTALRFATSNQDYSSFSERMRITSAGSVGIGITAPLTELHVAATTDTEIRASENTNNNYISLYQQAANSYLIAGGPSSSPLMIYTGASERMRITGAGNVGIGTSSPGEKLSIAGNIELTNGANRYIKIGSSTNYNYTLQSVGDDFQILEAGTTPRLTVKYPNGNVGIGTTAPATKLEVGGSVFGEFEALRLVNTANVAPNRGTSQTFYIPALTGSNEIGGKLLISRSSDNVGSYMALSTTTTNAAGVTEKMRIAASGNVGIGTTAPTSKLQVVGLPSYLDNAAAIAGGLTVGAFYHTAGVVKVVI